MCSFPCRVFFSPPSSSSQHCLSSNNESLWCCCSWFKLVSSSFVLGFDLVLNEFKRIIIEENKLSVATLFAGRNLRRAVEFGKTHVVRPKGKHQATIVWLHGLGDNGSRYLFLNGGYILYSKCLSIMTITYANSV